MTQNTIEDRTTQEHYNNESISAYTSILSQYLLIDENFDTNEVFVILSKKLGNLTESELKIHETNFLKIFKSLDQHPRIGKLLLKHFTVFFLNFLN